MAGTSGVAPRTARVTAVARAVRPRRDVGEHPHGRAGEPRETTAATRGDDGGRRATPGDAARRRAAARRAERRGHERERRRRRSGGRRRNCHRRRAARVDRLRVERRDARSHRGVSSRRCLWGPRAALLKYFGMRAETQLRRDHHRTHISPRCLWRRAWRGRRGEKRLRRRAETELRRDHPRNAQRVVARHRARSRKRAPFPPRPPRFWPRPHSPVERAGWARDRGAAVPARDETATPSKASAQL